MRFECKHCHRHDQYNPKKVRQLRRLQEDMSRSSRVGAIVAYLSRCHFCGHENRIPARLNGSEILMAAGEGHSHETRPSKSNHANSSGKSRAWQELALEQAVSPIGDFEEFLKEVGDVWPKNENLDDFLEWLGKERLERREVT